MPRDYASEAASIHINSLDNDDSRSGMAASQWISQEEKKLSLTHSIIHSKRLLLSPG
jgi:hypothetical protein